MPLHGKRDPWLAGQQLPGVRFTHNAHVEIIGGPASGEKGWLVSVTDVGSDPLYTVELASGGGDVEVLQSMLRPAA